MRILIITFILCMGFFKAHAQYENVNVGDVIDIKGVKSIVYQIDESGSHGKAMSVKCLRGIKDMWCCDDDLAKKMPVTDNESDGYANTEAIIEFARKENALSKFPVYEWCTKLGEGWYIPSLKELESFVNFWLGNEQMMDWDTEEETEYEIDNSKPFFKQVNIKMLDAGGVPFLNGVFTSTVDAEGKVSVFWFNQKKNSWGFKKRPKNDLSKYYVGRAFYRF